MHSDHNEHAAPPAETLRLGYEPGHVGLRPMVIGLFSAIVIAIIVFVASWFVEKIMMKMDMDKTAPMSSVRPAPITSAVPLPPLQPSGLAHPTVDRQDLAKMHADEDQVFINLGWKRDPSPVEDADKAKVVLPFRVPDSVLAAVAKRQAGLTPHTSSATRATPEPAAVTSPATAPGGAQ